MKPYHLTFCIFALVAVPLFAVSFAHNYQWDYQLSSENYGWQDIWQEITLHPDGRVQVRDERTFIAQTNAVQEVSLCMYLSEEAGFLAKGISVIEGAVGNPVGSLENCYDSEGNTGKALKLSFDEGVTQARLSFEYELTGTLKYYSDVVQWDWFIFVPDHAFFEEYSLVIHAPHTIEEKRYDIFLQGFDAETKCFQINSNGEGFHLLMDTMAFGEGVRVNYLMPPSSFIEQGSEPKLETLLAELNESDSFTRATSLESKTQPSSCQYSTEKASSDDNNNYANSNDELNQYQGPLHSLTTSLTTFWRMIAIIPLLLVNAFPIIVFVLIMIAAIRMSNKLGDD